MFIHIYASKFCVLLLVFNTVSGIRILHFATKKYFFLFVSTIAITCQFVFLIQNLNIRSGNIFNLIKFSCGSISKWFEDLPDKCDGSYCTIQWILWMYSGTCVDDIGGYNCKCKLGFTGIQYNVYLSIFFGTE